MLPEYYGSGAGSSFKDEGILLFDADGDGDNDMYISDGGYEQKAGSPTYQDRFYVNDGKLSCQLYQRSCDIFLGVPFNIASYALLTMMIAQVCGLELGDFVWTGGDCHLYTNHLEQTRLQLTREPRALPRMEINPAVTDLFQFKFEDFKLTGYEPHPAISAPVAV